MPTSCDVLELSTDLLLNIVRELPVEQTTKPLDWG